MPYVILFLAGLFIGSVVTFLLVTISQQEQREADRHRAYLASLATTSDAVASHHHQW